MRSVVPTTEWAYRERRPWAPMHAEEAVRLVDLASAAGVELWIDGGWGVDALLEEQTREHDDLDVDVELADVERSKTVLAAAGYEHVAGDALRASFSSTRRAGKSTSIRSSSTRAGAPRST